MNMKSIKKIAKKVNIGTASYDRLVNENVDDWYDEWSQASSSNMEDALISKKQAQEDLKKLLENAGEGELIWFLAKLVGDVDEKKTKECKEYIEKSCGAEDKDFFDRFLKTFTWFVTRWNKDGVDICGKFIKTGSKQDQEVYETESLPSNEEIEKQVKDYIGNRSPAFNLSDELGPDYEEVFIQYNKETNKLEFGFASNSGLLKDGEMEYDKTMDIQNNMEELYQVMIDYYRDHSDL